MSLFGGSSSSSSTTNLTQVDNTALGAEAQDDAVAAIIRGDNNKIEVLDAGAINSAFGFAERNASAYADATKAIVEKYGGSISQLATQNAGDLRSFAEYQSQNESGRLAQLVQWGIIAAVTIFAIQRFGKRAHA